MMIQTFVFAFQPLMLWGALVKPGEEEGWMFFPFTKILQKKKLFCMFDKVAVRKTGRDKFTIADFPTQLCTDIFIGFYGVEKPWLSLTDYRHIAAVREWDSNIYHLAYNGKLLKRHLTVGAPDTSPPNVYLIPVIDTVEHTKKFLLEVSHVLERKMFYGINYYWTASDPIQDSKFLRLVNYTNWYFSIPGASLYREYIQTTYSITVTISAYPLHNPVSDELLKVHRFADFLIVKPFDSVVDATPHLSHTYQFDKNSHRDADEAVPYLSTRRSVEWWEESGVPREKIIVAFQGYGRALLIPPSDAPNSFLYPGSIYNSSIIVSHSEVCRIVAKDPDSWSHRWDFQWQAAFYSRKKGQNREWIFYNEEKTVEHRIHWLSAKNYGGMMFWTLETDDFIGDCSKTKFPILRHALNTFRLIDAQSNNLSFLSDEL